MCVITVSMRPRAGGSLYVVRSDQFEVGEGDVEAQPLGEADRQGFAVYGSELVVTPAPVEPALFDGVDPALGHDNDQVDRNLLTGVLRFLVREVGFGVGAADLDGAGNVFGQSLVLFIGDEEAGRVGGPDR